MRPSTPMSRFACRVTAAATLSLGAISPGLSQSRAVTTPSAVLAAPKGRAIGSVHPGGSFRVLETRGAYAKVSIDGFVERTKLSSQRGGTTRVGSRAAIVRARGTASARSVASLDAGTNVALVSGTAPTGWVRVTREGWILRGSLERPALADAGRPAAAARPRSESKASGSRKASGGEVAASSAKAPTPAPPTTPKREVAPARSGAASTSPAPIARSAAAAPLSDSTLVPTSNIALRAAPDARPLATIAQGTTLIPLARDRGWVRVRLEGWVQERDVAPADTSVRNGVSAADLRADPLGSRGKVVRWSVQVLAKQKADVLRRDLAPDETYLLARGPYEENALLYLVVPPSLMAAAKSMPELTQAMITARVRTGKSDLVGVPILDLLTITPRK